MCSSLQVDIDVKKFIRSSVVHVRRMKELNEFKKDGDLEIGDDS